MVNDCSDAHHASPEEMAAQQNFQALVSDEFSKYDFQKYFETDEICSFAGTKN